VEVFFFPGYQLGYHCVEFVLPCGPPDPLRFAHRMR